MQTDDPQTDDPGLRHWQSMLEARPAHPPALIGMTKALAALGRPNDILALARTAEASSPALADKVLKAGLMGLPRDLGLAEAYCRIAELGGDAAETAARWALLRKRQPRRLETHLGYIEAMLRLNRFDEAERAGQSALSVLRSRAELHEALARVAEARGDWAEAGRRWGELLARRPRHAEAAARRHAAEQKAATAEPVPLASPPAVAVPAVVESDAETAALKKLFTGFESLGRNCEFGLLQRRFGAEPLGLLRFSSARVQTLLSLLRTRFAGLGDPDDMKLVDIKREYLLVHVSSDWGMHTRIKPAPDVDPAAVLKTQCRHISFLRTKLMKDLQRPTKICVFQKPDLRDHEIDRIYTALQAYGPNMLMCVRLYDADHPAGTVEWRSERLMVATIDRQGHEFKGAGWDISVDHWAHFCRIAQDRWNASGAAPAPP